MRLLEYLVIHGHARFRLQPGGRRSSTPGVRSALGRADEAHGGSSTAEQLTRSSSMFGMKWRTCH